MSLPLFAAESDTGDAQPIETKQIQQEQQLKQMTTQAQADISKPEPLSRDEVLLELEQRLAAKTQGS